MRYATTVIIGTGQSGLAMSKYLTGYSIDHVLLERGEVANSWQKERWDSLRLLTPNWQSRLPGYTYSGADPDGYMSMHEIASYLKHYARLTSAPVQPATLVSRVCRADGGYQVETDQGSWRCRALVIASGACNISLVPAISAELPRSVVSMTPMEYRNPGHLPEGDVMIVGASATGVQLAKEICASGRHVTLCAGEHIRLPRVYRGRDILWWMDVIGAMNMRYDEVDDLHRLRHLPSLQLIGTPERETIDLNGLRKLGVEVVGRLVGLRDGKAQFSGSLANQYVLADLKMNRLLSSIDAWITANHQDALFNAPCRYEPTHIEPQTRLNIDLADGSVGTVIWATGYRPDYSWLDVPVFDRKGRLQHDGGVVRAPGLYVIGLPFMRRRKSSFIDGAGDDAADLAAHLNRSLYRAAA